MSQTTLIWIGCAVAAYFYWPQIMAWFSPKAAAKTPTSNTSAELLAQLRTKLLASGAKSKEIEELTEPIRIKFLMLEDV